MVTGIHACHCGQDGCQRDAELREAGWFDGYGEATRVAAFAAVKSGMFEQAALADRLIAEAHLVTHPVPEPVQPERWHE